MTDWDYLVPTLNGVPWAATGARYSTDLEWPRVGVYCSHEPEPWLLGSYSVSDAVLTETGSAYWGWARDYPTGDGYLIHLGRQSGDSGRRELVGDQVRDRDQERQRLASMMGQDLSGEAAQSLLDEIANADATSRGNVTLRCGICSLRPRFRSESVQGVLSVFWQLGVREVSLEQFARRVTRRRA